MVKSDFLEIFAQRLRRLHILSMIDDVELKARVARARASLVVNPLSGRHYGAKVVSGEIEKATARR